MVEFYVQRAVGEYLSKFVIGGEGVAGICFSRLSKRRHIRTWASLRVRGVRINDMGTV
jgi:hypothetical protein